MKMDTMHPSQMIEFLFECICGEIPESLQPYVISEMKKNFCRTIEEYQKIHRCILIESKRNGNIIDNIQCYVTPKRITIVISNLQETGMQSGALKKGPKINAPDKARDGFCRANSVTQDLLIEDNGYYWARIPIPKLEVLLKKITEEVFQNFWWPKTIQISDTALPWIRPIYKALGIMYGDMLPAQSLSIELGNVTVSNTTQGLYITDAKYFEVNSFQDYKDKLDSRGIIISWEERKKKILNFSTFFDEKSVPEEIKSSFYATGSITKDCKYMLVQPPEKLLDDISGLVECPCPIVGVMDSALSDPDSSKYLPPSYIEFVLRKELRMMVVCVSQNNHLGSNDKITHFLYVANMQVNDIVLKCAIDHVLENSEITIDELQKKVDAEIKDQNYTKDKIERIRKDVAKYINIVNNGRKIINARLSDVAFFYNQTIQKSIDYYREKSDEMSVYKDFGTIKEKRERIVDVLSSGIPSEGVRKQCSGGMEIAMRYMYADLATPIVHEIPEFSGFTAGNCIDKYGCDEEREDQDRVVIGRYINYYGYFFHMPLESLINKHTRDIGDLSLSKGALLCASDMLDTLVMLLVDNQYPTSHSDRYGMKRLSGFVYYIFSLLENTVYIEELLDLLIEKFEKYGKKIDALYVKIRFLELIYKRLEAFVTSNKYRLGKYCNVRKDICKSVLDDIMPPTFSYEQWQNIDDNTRGNVQKEVKRIFRVVFNNSQKDHENNSIPIGNILYRVYVGHLLFAVRGSERLFNNHECRGDDFSNIECLKDFIWNVGNDILPRFTRINNILNKADKLPSINEEYSIKDVVGLESSELYEELCGIVCTICKNICKKLQEHVADKSEVSQKEYANKLEKEGIQKLQEEVYKSVKQICHAQKKFAEGSYEGELLISVCIVELYMFSLRKINKDGIVYKIMMQYMPFCVLDDNGKHVKNVAHKDSFFRVASYLMAREAGDKGIGKVLDKDWMLTVLSNLIYHNHILKCIDKLMDNVMILDENDKDFDNRISLLRICWYNTRKIMDFNKIEK